MTTIETKAGRRPCGEHQGELHLSFLWFGSSKRRLLKVTAIGEVFLVITGSGPPSEGENLPKATCSKHARLKGEVWGDTGILNFVLVWLWS